MGLPSLTVEHFIGNEEVPCSNHGEGIRIFFEKQQVKRTMADLPQHLYFYDASNPPVARPVSNVFAVTPIVTAIDGPFTHAQPGRAGERKKTALCLPHQCGSVEAAHLSLDLHMIAQGRKELTAFFRDERFKCEGTSYVLDVEDHGDELKIHWFPSTAQLQIAYFGMRGAHDRLYQGCGIEQLEHSVLAAIRLYSIKKEASAHRRYGYMQMPERSASITERLVF